MGAPGLLPLPRPNTLGPPTAHPILSGMVPKFIRNSSPFARVLSTGTGSPSFGGAPFDSLPKAPPRSLCAGSAPPDSLPIH